MAADGSVIIEIQGDDAGFKDKLSSLGSIAGTAMKGVTAAVTAATTAVTGMAAAAIKVGSGFESSMSQVAATMGITNEELANGSESFDILQQAAKDAGATTAFSASQAADALNYLALAGYDAQTAADTLPAVLNLAAAGSMDLAYASDLATDAMSALGIEASSENLTKFGDEMAKTASKANTSVSQLGEAILTVGGTAKSLAGGTTELNAALGVLANRGIKGSEGGTALRNIILALSAPTDKAADAMAALGLEVYDATGNMRPLNEVFKDLDAAMAGMTEGEKTEVLNEIFNKVDLKSAQALLAGCGDEFTNLAAAIEDSGGAMQDMADTQLNNLQGDLTILQSALEGVGISAYESMQGPLRETVQMATGMVGEIAAAFEEGGLSGAVGAVGGVLSEIVTALANAAPSMINAGVQLLQSLLTGIQTSLPELTTGAVNIVTSLVNGIIVLLPQLVETAVTLVASLATGIAEALPTLIPAAVSAIVTLVTGLIENIPLLVDAALQLLQGLAQGLLDAIPVLLEALPTIITSLITALLESIPLIIEAGVQLLTALVGALPEIIATIVAVLPQIIDGIINALLANLPLIVQAGIDLLVALIQAMPTIITTIVQALPQIITSIINALLDNLPLLIDAGVQLFVALIQNLPTIIVEIVKAVPQIVAAIVDGFLGLAGDISDIGTNIVSGIWDGISGMASWIKEKVTGFFSGVVDGVKDFLGISSPSKVFSEIGGYTIEGYADGVDSGAGKNEQRVLSAVEGLSSDMADSFSNGGAGSGQALMQNLTNAAAAALPSVQAAATQTVTTFCETIRGQLPQVQQVATEVMRTLCDLVIDTQGDIVTVATQTATTFCDTIRSKRQEFYDVGVAAMNGLNEGLRIQGQQAIATARSIANSIIAEMRRAMDIHSPSRKMRDLVGAPAGEGLIVGFEEALANFHRRAAAVVNEETGLIAANVSAQADGKAAAEGITREVRNTTRTVEKVARLEGDGITGELVRMLGLRLKEEDNRVGPNPAEA